MAGNDRNDARTDPQRRDTVRPESARRVERAGTHDPAGGAAPARRWQDVVTLVLGALLLLSPLVIVGTPVFVVDAIVVGGLIALASLWALAVPSAWLAEASNVLLGAGLFLAPWLLGFITVLGTWSAWIVGPAVAILAATALPRARRLARRREAVREG